MPRIKLPSGFPRDWKRCPDQGIELWVESYRGDNVIFQIRGSTPMLAMLNRDQAKEVRDFLNALLESDPQQG